MINLNSKMMMASMTNLNKQSQRGFTLVEISIVLIIISILIGGVLTGTNLLRSARLRSIMQDKDLYISAIEQFKERYHALPGDMSNATAIWGEEDADFTTCALLTTASATKKTCNGNGDDSIAKVPDVDDVPGSPMDSNGTEYKHEYFRAWQHLANAGLIDGSFSGVNRCSSSDACYKAGTNAPSSDLRNTTWSIFDMAALASMPSYIYTGVEYKHVFYFGGENTGNHMNFGSVLTPKELWNIDTKFDDTLPGQGKIMSLEPVTVDTWDNRNACATTTNPSTAKYNVSNTNQECIIIFRLSF